MIGVGVDSKQLQDPLQLHLYKQFNFWTTENELKFKRATKGYEDADLIINSTLKQVRGHLQISHRNVPETTSKEALRSYVIETIRRYPQINQWDLVGEAIADVGKLRDYWRRIEFTISDIVSWAKEANPANLYFYSDYNLKATAKWKQAIKLVNEFDLNLAIQFHHHDYGRVWLMGDWLEPLITAIKGRCLISEVSIESTSEVSQAICYNRLFKLINKHKIDACIWNLTDAKKNAYLFDKNFKPKLSYFEVAQYLSQNPS